MREENKVEYKNIGGFNFEKRMPDAACEVIVAAARGGSRERIRVFCGDIETGRSFNDIYETQGYVGRSTGGLPIALLIATTRSQGGGPICGGIVRITKNKKVLYTHPNFHTGEMKIVVESQEGKQVNTVYVRLGTVWVAKVYAASQQEAKRWIAFFQGTRNKV